MSAKKKTNRKPRNKVVTDRDTSWMYSTTEISETTRATQNIVWDIAWAALGAAVTIKAGAYVVETVGDLFE